MRVFSPILEDSTPGAGRVVPIALPDGGVLVSTNNSHVDGLPIDVFVRLDTNGNRVPNFEVDLPVGARAMCVYPDGKLLASVPVDYPEPDLVYRLLSDGSRDPAFAPVAIESSDIIRAKTRADGKAWVFGVFEKVAGISRVSVVRLLPSGALDTSFVSPFSAMYDQDINDLADQPDGKVVLAGRFLLAGGARRSLIRLNADGSIDTSFDAEANGLVASAASVAFLSSGRILATDGKAVVRLAADGSADTGYIPSLPVDGSLESVGLVRQNGHVYFVQTDSPTAKQLRRLKADGSLDTGFAASTPEGVPYSVSIPATWDETTFYVGSGMTDARTQARHVLSKLDAAGALQVTFAPRFSVHANLHIAGRSADGSYLLHGWADYANGVRLPQPEVNTVRLRSDGSIDRVFSLPSGSSPISVEPDGHFTVQGDFGPGWTHARYSPSGDVISKFPISGSALVVSDMKGGLYAANATALLAHYLANGTLDSSFAPALTSQPSRILPTADGKVYVVVYEPTYEVRTRLMRLLSNGSVDPGFPPVVYSRLPDLMVVLPDGGLMTVVEVLLPSQSSYLQFARYNAAGQQVSAYRGLNDPLVVAGVALDYLRAVQVDGSITLLPPINTLSGPLLSRWTHVRSDGQLSIATGTQFDGRGPLVRYLRTSSTSPSVATAPTIATPPVSQTVAERSPFVFFNVTALGLEPFSYQWYHNGTPVSGAHANNAILELNDVSLADAGNYTVTVTNPAGGATSPAATLTVDATLGFLASPTSRTVERGDAATFTARLSGSAGATLQWSRNGVPITGATSATLLISSVQPQDTGVYTVTARSGGASVSSDAAILGLVSTEKVVGAGELLQPDNIRHPNGNIFDQVLLTGIAESVTAEYSPDPALNQITRTSFVDIDHDIVQVELSGPGTLSLVLDEAQGPALPLNYNQPVNYMRGHASIVITGATAQTNVSVFSVGRATAFDRTGRFNILEPISVANDPANNGSPLFDRAPRPEYDGIAEIAFIAISSSDGKFGGVRTGNVHYFAAEGVTGLFAPGVEFQGPVYLGDITAFNDATPVMLLGGARDVRVTGGDMQQYNGKRIQVTGIERLKFTAGIDAEGRSLPAQQNAGIFEQDGFNVTPHIVVNP